MNTQTLLVALVSFIFGGLLGFFGRGWLEHDDRITPNVFVMIAVTTVFVASVLTELINPIYKTSPMLYGLMGGIVGFFFKPVNPPTPPEGKV